jgi:hypothetical protein
VGWRPRPRLELGVGGIALKWVAPEPLAVVTTAGLPKLALEDMALEDISIYKLGCLVNRKKKTKVF